MEYEEIEEEQPSLLKKVSVLIMSLFLIFLIVSFTFTGVLGDIVASLIESETIEDGLVELEDFSVQFDGDSYEVLLGVYNDNQENKGNKGSFIVTLKTFNAKTPHNRKTIKAHNLDLPSLYIKNKLITNNM